MSTSCGSPCYAAPELVMNQGVYVGPAVDIWSCGVILFAMLCGYLPYDDDPANPESYNINLLYKYILNTPLIFPDYISDEACDLLSLMLVPDPEKRCSMDQIMNHPWLAPHKHLFVQVEKEEEEDLVMDEEEEPTSEPTRRNTIANIIINDKEEEQVVPEKIVEEEAIVEAAEATEAIVPEVEAVEEVENDQIMQDKPVAVNKEEEDTIMQEITSTELPPLTLIEDDETSAKKDDTLMTEPQTPVIVENTITTTKEGELHTVSPLPTTTKSTSKIRPRSTVSSSTEKVLHFLSGHSNTPKPTTTRNTSNEKKRTRHMSLANPSTATNKMDLASPPSPTTTTSTSSILHSKFLSSIRTTNKSPATTEVKAAPSPVAISASTPHPSQKNKRPVRPSTTVAPSPQPSPSPQPQQQQQRGARRKTLSLLVNSMTDNKPFNRRRSTLRSPLPPSTPTTVVEAPEEEKAEDKKQARMMPSVSEHTINTLSTAETNKEKHRSAGKKLMDWFKKKPLSKYFWVT
jgi:serine/threonine protein kinase